MELVLILTEKTKFQKKWKPLKLVSEWNLNFPQSIGSFSLYDKNRLIKINSWENKLPHMGKGLVLQLLLLSNYAKMGDFNFLSQFSISLSLEINCFLNLLYRKQENIIMLRVQAHPESAKLPIIRSYNTYMVIKAHLKIISHQHLNSNIELFTMRLSIYLFAH